MSISEIVIQANVTPAESVEATLSPLVENADVSLSLEQTRGIETAILVATVGAAGAALGALISGVSKVAAAKGARNIVIHGRSGRKLEIPAETSVDRISTLVEAAKDLDVERISF